MAVDIAGKPILITGASSGIGRVTAFACARNGMPVVLAARREEKLREAAAEIERAGGRASVVACDVTDAASCEAAVERCAGEFGSVYAVFANAGYGYYEEAVPGDDARVRAIFETNFYGTLNIIRPALARMREAGRGHVLICSSILSIATIPNHSAYCATKAAQHHLGRALGMELRGTGVHVSTVHPIGTRTEFFEKSAERTAAGDQGKRVETPGFLMQRPERVARGVVRCLRRPRPEVWTSFGARMLAVTAAGMPRLTRWLVARVGE